MPTAESTSATAPKPSESSAGERRLSSERSTRSSIVRTSKTGSSRSSDAITPRSDVVSERVARPRLHGERHEPRRRSAPPGGSRRRPRAALGDVVQLDVGHHADHGQEHGLVGHRQQVVEVRREVHPPADRVLAGPEARASLRVHDHHLRRAVRVASPRRSGRRTSVSAHRLEVAGRDLHLRGRDHRLARLHLIALGDDHAVVVRARRRGSCRSRRRPPRRAARARAAAPRRRTCGSALSSA